MSCKYAREADEAMEKLAGPSQSRRQSGRKSGSEDGERKVEEDEEKVRMGELKLGPEMKSLSSDRDVEKG